MSFELRGSGEKKVEQASVPVFYDRTGGDPPKADATNQIPPVGYDISFTLDVLSRPLYYCCQD